MVIAKDELKKYIDGGKVLLATGNSFEMFGNKIDDDEALGITVMNEDVRSIENPRGLKPLGFFLFFRYNILKL